jgi:hypothetical protein
LRGISPSEGQRMVSGNRSSGSLGINLGESLEGKDVAISANKRVLETVF